MSNESYRHDEEGFPSSSHQRKHTRQGGATLLVASKCCLQVVSIISLFKTITYLVGKWVKHTHSPGICLCCCPRRRVSVCDVSSWSRGVGLHAASKSPHNVTWRELHVALKNKLRMQRGGFPLHTTSSKPAHDVEEKPPTPCQKNPQNAMCRVSPTRHVEKTSCKTNC